MAHVRTQLRQAVATALTGLATPANVYAERRHRLDVSEMPLIIFSLQGDTAQADERAMGQPFTVERDSELVLELHAMGVSGEAVSDTLDQMELESEQALVAAWESWGLLEILAPSTSEIEFSVDQDRVAGLRSVTYIATWRSDFGSPDIAEG